MKAPTREELMRLVDGELDPARAAEVEAFVRADARARAYVESLKFAARLVEIEALERADAGGADGIAALVMAEVEKTRERGVPARVSGRVRVVVAGAALAAAAAAVLWATRDDRVPYTPTAVAAGVTLPTPAHDEEAPTTEVLAVDFGARAGTIFYVPSGAATTTAVVWLTDDDVPAGGSEGR